MPLFWNYLGPYPCFETRFTQNQIQHRYKSLKRCYREKKKKTRMELNLEKIEFQNVIIGP